MPEYFKCSCGRLNHLMEVNIYDNKELYFGLIMNPHRRLWKKIWQAIQYILAPTAKLGGFAEILLSRSDAIRLSELVDEFIADTYSAEQEK